MAGYDVIVLGGGAVGASTLFHLSRSNRKALLLEKMAGYGRGATGSWGSLLRCFHMNTQTTVSATESLPFYLEFEKHTGRPFVWNRTGSLYFIRRDESESFDTHFSTLKNSTLESHLIEAKEGKQRFPQFTWYQDDLAIYEPNAGVACPWSTTESWIRAAEKNGAEARLNTEITDVETKNGRVTAVRTSSGERIECGQLVLATGVWTCNWLAKLGIASKVTTKSIQLNRFCRRHHHLSSPFFIDKNAETFGHASNNGSFIGGYLKPEAKQSTERVNHLSLKDASVAKQKIAHRLPWVKSATLEGGIRALESYTESTNGVVDSDASLPNLIISAGWSCSGFTLAPLIGRKVADRVLA